MATHEWQKPTVTEIKMDAEISSYQEDERDPLRDAPPIATPRSDEPTATER